MKRKAAITALILILIVAFTQFAYADSLSIIKTVPDDGETGKQPANLAVKIVFSEDMSAEANDAINSGCVKIRDAEGNVQNFKLVHHEKYPNELWFVLESDLETDTEYTVTVSEGIKSTAGNTLTSAKTFSFKTRNTKRDNSVSLALTFGMMALMMFFTTRSVNKQASEQNSAKKAAPEKIAQTDPYRLAREQGISVDEAKAMIAREKDKLNKKSASAARAREKYEKEQAEMEAEIRKRMQDIHDASVYKVKGPGSLKAHGKKLPKYLEKKFAAKKKSNKK